MISVDSVYQKVLALANKEQRGYITPQEFNLFADHAQMDIFRQYFYDLNQSSRLPSNDTVYGNPTKIIEEKISMFEVYDSSHSPVDNDGNVLISPIDPLFFKLTSVKVAYGDHDPVFATEISIKETGSYKSSNTLIRSMEHHYPRYTSNSYVGTNDSSIKIFPHPATTDLVFISYVRKPKTPNWTYIMSGENALYNMTAGDHEDFELHFSEENTLVVKILQLAGINIKDSSLVQIASQEEIKKIQQEKS